MGWRHQLSPHGFLPMEGYATSSIEAEVLEALGRDRGIELAPHEHRRNLTTRGVPLGHLVGQNFRIGECVLYGGRLNVPCLYLENLTGKKVFKPLLNRSGLNCRIIVGGMVTVQLGLLV
jgi:MOSC domain-containing protein YiiM